MPTNGPGIGNRNVAAELVFSKFDIDVDKLIFSGGDTVYAVVSKLQQIEFCNKV